jgi:mono/diheme cytochrome c family protein
MIPARMSRPVRVIVTLLALVAVAAIVSACGTQKISASKSDPNTHAGAVIFSQRCGGCHTLSYAGTHGSASNVRSRLITNGPNFNVRCERPVTRVLYAIENGGFSGAVMPQNIVVGQDAENVAKFVATYAGRQAANTPGTTTCVHLPIGSLPSATTTTTSASTTTTTTTTTSPSVAHHAASHKRPAKKP